jgi:hypothetical protein
MYPAGALLVAQALQEDRLREAEARRTREPQPRLRPMRPEGWDAILRFPRFRLADAKG